MSDSNLQPEDKQVSLGTEADNEALLASPSLTGTLTGVPGELSLARQEIAALRQELQHYQVNAELVHNAVLALQERMAPGSTRDMASVSDVSMLTMLHNNAEKFLKDGIEAAAKLLDMLNKERGQWNREKHNMLVAVMKQADSSAQLALLLMPPAAPEQVPTPASPQAPSA